MTERPRPNRRKMVGNEFVGGGRQPALPSRQAIFGNAGQLRSRLIETAAKPPVLPLPPAINTPPVSKIFNRIAYSLLLTGLLGAVSAGTTYVNWAFLALGVLAVLARFSSQLLFTSALFSLLAIPAATAFQKNGVADIFAVMTFYFLLIGLVRSILEERRSNKGAKKKAKKQKRNLS